VTADPFRDRRTVAGLAREIATVARRLPRPVTLMEVCGTHTHAIAEAGLRRLMPPNVRLVSGPGCPVCVTPVSWLDRALALGRERGTVLATFGDLVRVPSSTGTLEELRAHGGHVEIVYSPRDAVEFAAAHPEARVVFLAVGFETTAPPIAAALAEAEARGISNFLLLPGNKTMPGPLAALADAVDGFLMPGHVSVITGAEAWRFLPERHGVSAAVAGFTPADVLAAILALLRRIARGEPGLDNLYGRVVTPGGNREAQALLARTFEPTDAEWRGLGVLPGSGLGLREGLAHRDASRIPVDLPEPREPAGCRCGDVLHGEIDPPGCPLFAGACTPERPVGACMVSSEGACAAWYRHERWAREATE